MTPDRPIHTHRADARDARPAPVWVPCALCWGQRVIWETREARDGGAGGWAAGTCEACLGLGEVLA